MTTTACSVPGCPALTRRPADCRCRPPDESTRTSTVRVLYPLGLLYPKGANDALYSS